MNIFATDRFALPLPDGHRFPVAKYARLRERIATAPWLPVHRVMEPAPATATELMRAHAPHYVERMLAGQMSERDMRRIGFPWTPQLVERSLRATGATLYGARAALHDGVAISLAGGTHHACYGHGEGYCVFNDSAVAALTLHAEGLVRRVLIVDLDVHQGNGSADILREHEWCYTFSIHGAKNYPFRKIAGDCDIALPDQTGDDAYLETLYPALDLVMHTARPDLLIYVSGADAFAGDSLGRLALSKAGLATRDRVIRAMAHDHGVPVMVTMAGGYGYNIEDTVDIHYQTVCVMLGV
jgi:acetoin utilization deacetylase AcuC-like enzyme